VPQGAARGATPVNRFRVNTAKQQILNSCGVAFRSRLAELVLKRKECRSLHKDIGEPNARRVDGGRVSTVRGKREHIVVSAQGIGRRPAACPSAQRCDVIVECLHVGR
jgi:hypothetical protein